LFDLSKCYLGRLCKFGHSWEDTNQTLRYLCDNGCAECRRIRSEAYRVTPGGKEKFASAQAKYRKSEKGIRYTSEYGRRPDRAEARAANQLRYGQTTKGKATRKKSEVKYAQTENRRVSWRRKQIKRERLIADRSEFYSKEDINNRFATFDNACVYCGSQEKLTVDHFYPINLGGFDAIWNIVPACLSCNASKQDDIADVWYRRKSFYSGERWQLLMDVMVNNG
jgi:5-methylcytosine-specific restriction endonuclease McrA